MNISLPLRRGPVRFAVGSSTGLTSNTWRVWTGKGGDVYFACRDNFKEAKVSLHASGRWRMGFTTEAVTKDGTLLAGEQNRAWEVWDKPPASPWGAVAALHLVFPTSELAVRPDQRPPGFWKNVVYVEPASPGQMVLVTLFVTEGDPVPETNSPGRTIRLASLAVTERQCAQLSRVTLPKQTCQLSSNNVSQSLGRRRKGMALSCHQRHLDIFSAATQTAHGILLEHACPLPASPSSKKVGKTA
jgi:hypothetical protein